QIHTEAAHFRFSLSWRACGEASQRRWRIDVAVRLWRAPRKTTIEHRLHQAERMVLLVGHIKNSGNEKTAVQQDDHQKHGRAAQGINGASGDADDALRRRKDNRGRLVIGHARSIHPLGLACYGLGKSPHCTLSATNPQPPLSGGGLSAPSGGGSVGGCGKGGLLS